MIDEKLSNIYCLRGGNPVNRSCGCRLMPIGHQANILVFGPGGYKFFDYTKVGVWLNIIIFIVVAITLPIVWPLDG